MALFAHKENLDRQSRKLFALKPWDHVSSFSNPSPTDLNFKVIDWSLACNIHDLLSSLILHHSHLVSWEPNWVFTLTNEIQAGFASKYFTTRASASEMHKKEASDINDEANYRRKSRTRMWKKSGDELWMRRRRRCWAWWEKMSPRRGAAIMIERRNWLFHYDVLRPALGCWDGNTLRVSRHHSINLQIHWIQYCGGLINEHRIISNIAARPPTHNISFGTSFSQHFC
jgi:hypothetical protein